MDQKQPETREQEVARVRSYLASQALRRTPAQIVEALRDAQRQFLEATIAIPASVFLLRPSEEEWSAAAILGHVHAIATMEERAIRGVIERGERPSDSLETFEPALAGASRESLLKELETMRERLIASVLAADAAAHLDIVWGHGEFGQMNWREWLLFARVHTLDHARQMQAIAAALI